jgi:hypothetical protein
MLDYVNVRPDAKMATAAGFRPGPGTAHGVTSGVEARPGAFGGCREAVDGDGGMPGGTSDRRRRQGSWTVAVTACGPTTTQPLR